MTDVRHHSVQVPATTANLGPGFDAFGLALDRYLAVRSRPRGDQTERVVTRGAGSGELPTGDDNLVWRSLVAFCERHDVAVPDVALEGSCDIPLERGLGSSSAAIVAGITLARALTGTVVGDPEVVEFATELEGHPDNVAPAVVGGLVACVGDGDGLVVRRINPTPRLRPYVLVPATRQSTQAARAVLPESLPRAAAAQQAARAGHVLAALAGAWPASPAVAGDLLHEPARRDVMPASAAALDALRDAGLHAWLSGAGPAVALALDRTDVDAQQRMRAVAGSAGFELLTTDVDLSGAIACPDDGCALAGSGDCVQCPRRRV